MAGTTRRGGLDTEAALRAFAHPGRRRVLELVAARQLSSGEIAAACGWSRPATSQHLRVLRESALVVVTVNGNRRLYQAHQQNLQRLRAFLDHFWTEQLTSLNEELEQTPRSQPTPRESARWARP
jgi:DNA-binding transcriptional ArsR family regulator